MEINRPLIFVVVQDLIWIQCLYDTLYVPAYASLIAKCDRSRRNDEIRPVNFTRADSRPRTTRIYRLGAVTRRENKILLEIDWIFMKLACVYWFIPKTFQSYFHEYIIITDRSKDLKIVHECFIHRVADVKLYE